MDTLVERETKIALKVGASVIVIWAASGFMLYCLPDRGTFGDMFGAVNSLFSGLAFVGVIWAILYQRREQSENANAQERAARLQALTVLFSEYKLLYQIKQDELSGILSLGGQGESADMVRGRMEIAEKVKQHRDYFWDCHCKIMDELEKNSGVIFSKSAQPFAAGDAPQASRP